MLLISLVASLLCFFVASLTMSRQKRTLLGPALYCALIALFGPMFIGVISLPTLLFAVVLFCMMFCWSQEAWSIRSFRLASLLALFAIYGCFSIRAFYQLNELNQQYAIVQMDERLPPSKAVPLTEMVTLSDSSRAQLNDVEEAYLEKEKDDFSTFQLI
jgi:D-alanyl-lipoteichoic acid acyltransferase DltB (MBOAT superfamily)